MSPQAVVILHQCNYTFVNDPQERPAQRHKKDSFDELDMAYVTRMQAMDTRQNFEGVTPYPRSGNCEALIAPHISCCFSTTFLCDSLSETQRHSLRGANNKPVTLWGGSG